MKIDIMDDGFWERLVEGAKLIPKDFNQRLEASIRKEKAEIAERQNCQFETPKACPDRTTIEGDTLPPKTAKRHMILAKFGVEKTGLLPHIRGKRAL
jgi:hypothetical protein